MKNFHILFGFFVIIAFALTGQYMAHYHHHLIGMADGPRMLYRTRHIFILLAGLLILGLGTYWKNRTKTWRKVMQIFASSMIMVAAVLFIVAFFWEPTLEGLQVPLSSKAMYLIAGGTLLHFFSGLKQGHS